MRRHGNETNPSKRVQCSVQKIQLIREDDKNTSTRLYFGKSCSQTLRLEEHSETAQ
jgi:hypothetical protein